MKCCNNKDFDDIQELRKLVIDYRISIETKLLSKLREKESPRMLRARKLELEKWVDKEIKETNSNLDPEIMKQRTISIISDTNLLTERIYSFIQRLNASQSHSSNTLTVENLNSKNTIDELLRTDSDQSPMNITEQRPISEPEYSKDEQENDDEDDDAKSDTTFELLQRADGKGYEDINISETTQELIDKDYSNVFTKSNADDIIDSKQSPTKPRHVDPHESEPMEEEQPSQVLSQNNSNIIEIGPTEISREYPTTSESEEGIIVTEVDLYTPDAQQEESKEIIVANDQQKSQICDEIISSLLDEIQMSLFPARALHPHDSKHRYEAKFVEKYKVSDPKRDYDETQEQDNDSDISMNEYEGEIMHKFHIMRNFEMKRTRADKTQYDSIVFMSYVEEVFDAIMSREDLFLKAFSKPIQKDYLECLTKLHYHGLIPEVEEDIDNSLINELDNQACILTIELYLSLERRREKYNDELKQQVTDMGSNIDLRNLDVLLPIELLQPSNESPDTTQVIGKLSMFGECEHIHNKAIFDAINEALNQIRPHGKKGEPLPWTGKHSFTVDYSRLNMHVLEKVKDIILEWNSFKCGVLPCKEMYHNNHFDEEKFSDFRERKIISILAYDIDKEDQEKWVDYEDEESQVKLDLADMILDSLVEETAMLLNKVEEKNKPHHL